MREIRFRAWDSVQEKMLPVEKLNFREQYVSLDEGDNSVTDTFEIFELMQYTGLKDKNGKEIYEGDIIEIVDSIGSHICVVKFINGCFVSVELGDSGEVCLREDIDNFPHTIIGNIYENTELLSKTN